MPESGRVRAWNSEGGMQAGYPVMVGGVRLSYENMRRSAAASAFGATFPNRLHSRENTCISACLNYTIGDVQNLASAHQERLGVPATPRKVRSTFQIAAAIHWKTGLHTGKIFKKGKQNGKRKL